MNSATSFNRPFVNPAPIAPVPTPQQSLRACVEQAMESYFQNLEGQTPSNVYDMVMSEVEAPMLQVVLKYNRHNQTRASNVLGLNRGTMRKMLKKYGML